MSVRGGMAILGAALALSAGACPPGGQEHGSVMVLRSLATGLEQHRARTGAYPASLDEVCRPGAGCPGFPSAARLFDEWDRPVVYTARDGTYELRSAGRDGRSGTADDLAFSPEAERRRRALFAGCYRLSPSVPYAATGRLQLDTLPRPSGWSLFVRPDEDWRHAEWFPLGDSVSVLVRFDNPHRHTVIEFRPAPGGLAGRQVHGGRGTFTATREPCP